VIYLVAPERSMWLLYEADNIGCIEKIPDLKKLNEDGKSFMVFPLEETGERPAIVCSDLSETYKGEVDGVVRALRENRIFGRPFTIPQIAMMRIFLGIEHDAEEDEEE
jgi:hypothetical protein